MGKVHSRPKVDMIHRQAITPRNVIKQYAGLHGGPVHLRHMLALALREGDLRARALHREESSERSWSAIWKKCSFRPPAGKKSYSAEHDIRRSVWWRSASWSDDILHWNFSKSRMHVTISIDPPVRLLFSAVSFYKDDIVRLLGESTIPFPKELKPLTNKQAWARFWHELIFIAAGGRENLIASLLGPKSSDESITDELLAIFREQDELTNVPRADDAGFSDRLSARLPFDLSASTLQREIKELRRTFELTRGYVRKKVRK